MAPPPAIKMLMYIVFLAFVMYFLRAWNTELHLNAPWKPDVDAILFSQKPLLPPPPLTTARRMISSYALPLRTQGRNVVDAEGRRFRLQSVNWYGASDELFVPGGLDVQHRRTIARVIRDLGFNSVRLPYSDELVARNPVIEHRLVSANGDLAGLPALDVLEAVVSALTEEGIAVILNNHITSATWCCGWNPCDAGWANDHLGPLCRVRQTEEQWIRHWETLAGRFQHDPLVIGADLRNEVRGAGWLWFWLWPTTMTWSRWAAAAERCGNRLLKRNPHWLIIVEGTAFASDLSGVAQRPVELDLPDRVVYSSHAYSWSWPGWGAGAGAFLPFRFSQLTYPSFQSAMRRRWGGDLLDDDVAPVWIGEMGAPRDPTEGEVRYWRNLWRWIGEREADFGYWALNPRKARGNETERFGLVGNEWVTPVVDYRMRDMVELMRRGL